MTFRLFTVLIVLLALSLLAACGAAPTPAPATATPLPPTTTALPATAQPSSEVVAVVERSGGIAGETEIWTIHWDGQIVSDKGVSRQVSPTELRETINQIVSLGFFELEDSYGTTSTCNDCFTYRMTIDTGQQSKTVTAVQEAEETPDVVRQIIMIFSELVSGVEIK